jgi:hypothetical protein
MKVIIEPASSGNIIATIAMGTAYFEAWQTYALPTWKKYCEKHELGLVVFDEDLLDKTEQVWKKATWQKLLMGSYLSERLKNVTNVCYIDSDFLINYYAPNIFDFYDPNTIGLVSQYTNMPYEELEVKKRIAYFRHYYYDEKYPLDSALFMSLKQIFEYHHLPVQNNYACAGLIVFNLQNHSNMMKTWFEKYDRNVHSITGGGDECHFNFEVQNWGKITWLDYKFQALWTYEMAWKYPFLYDKGRNNTELIRECIEASLFTNFFLHFAGSWYESEMWKIGGILESEESQIKFERFTAYMQEPVTGIPVGQIKPGRE